LNILPEPPTPLSAFMLKFQLYIFFKRQWHTQVLARTDFRNDSPR
jgi:hypothetical protein